MGDSKSQRKNRNAFHAGFLYIKIKSYICKNENLLLRYKKNNAKFQIAFDDWGFAYQNIQQTNQKILN